MVIDLFGVKARAELEAFRESAAKIDAARREEVQRLGALLNATIMKLLALTDKDAFRSVKVAEGEQISQGELPASPFMRRGSLAAAVKRSREAADAVSV